MDPESSRSRRRSAEPRSVRAGQSPNSVLISPAPNRAVALQLDRQRRRLKTIDSWAAAPQDDANDGASWSMPVSARHMNQPLQPALIQR
jgi:hypothetical protein